MAAATFAYGEREMAYLAGRDKRLGEAIALIGKIERPVHTDLFASLINNIVGQQISSKALETIWARLVERLGSITPAAVDGAALEDIQSCGMSLRKAGYIKEAAHRVVTGELALDDLGSLGDEEIIQRLVALKGIGRWTAEMLLIFSLQRPDVLSWDDLAIQRGLRMLYRHREMTRERFARYARRFRPWGTVASLYLWEIASGRWPEYTDPAKE